MQAAIMLRLVLVLVLQCLLTNGQGPGPGPGHEGGVEDKLQARAVDTRVKFSVMEGNPSSTFVGVIPLKSGFTYRFNEAPKEFTLNGTTGEIRTTGVLDREALNTDRFDLVVLSSQPTYPIEVRINVIDINDNSPRFPEPSIHVTFSESANAGTRVILDTATDGDAGDNDITTDYKIVDGNEDGKFKLQVTINPSGETPYLHLETTGKLDRETRASYQLNISAQDGGAPPRYGFLLVNVSILDVNDNPPIFDHSDYIVSLNESVPPGTSVLQVQATDNDVGENARLTYYLAETETQFAVDPETGVISTVEPLSCYQNCQQLQPCPKSCVFTVFARDHGSPLQDGRTYVTVNLLDANDHDPVVNFRYFPTTADFATVDENSQNGSVVAAVSVIDADQGPNGETTVGIRAGNELGHFRLDSRSGFDIVRVSGVLDREKISKYNVTIVATDKGTPPRSSTAFLIIHVNDINDHEPVFEKSEYSAVLSELVPIGTYVAGITANDEDTGVNSNIYYAIVSGNDNQWFDIDLQSGLITTKAPLDREVKDSIDLKISARDGGPSPKRAYTHLKISILDENDERPTFAREVVNVSLSENTSPDTLVTLLLAVDHDQGTNGSVTYMFDQEVEHNYPGIFALDVSSGRLTTKTKLDREAMPEYEIKVVAKDQGIPPLSSTATVLLQVQDVNDNSPEFYPQKYFVVVPEDLPPGSSVVQVSATDKDEGENAVTTYKLKGDEENDNTFEIDPETGIVSLSGSLSHIRKAQYRLTVAARDAGDRKAVEDATVDIVVESNQIELLEFKQSDGFAFSLPEDVAKKEPSVGRQVGEVNVVNPASVGEVSYAIIAGDPDKVFTIDEKTGVISTARRIDREQAAFYSLRTVATTASAYGRTWVNITIEDVNDNPPKFPITRAHATVAENWPVGHQVYLARAYDNDHGENSKISYNLSSNPDEYFTISRTSGMIYLNKPVKSSKSNVFRLEVAATDAGTPPLTSRQIVTITVEDVNDHTPIFEHGSYETSLLESTPVNDRFFALTASDEDDGMNGFVSYDITEGNAERKFGIFPDGYLYVRSALDREAQDYFALTIVARDHGTPPRSSTVSVVIHVIDENDNSPVFTNSTFTFYLDENEPPDTYVGKLTAADRDKGRNAELTYSIATNQNDFVVDPKSGFLKTLHYFDREELVQSTGLDYITMEAVVLDNGITRLRDKAKVNIYITDVNDNPPKFLRKPYRAQVPEGALLNTKVIRISATDDDEGLNGDVVYTIVDGNEEGRFKVDETTGQVTLAKPLDRESTPRYLLTVAAADLGSHPGLTATATLTVDVLDENDNAPEFTQSESEISIVETTPVNTVLIQFQASDADLGVNKEVSFMIGGGNMQEAFRIDTKTGTLYLERLLDFEKQSLYRLNITAADGGSPRLTSTISFVVHVLDYNDNPPAFPNTAIWRRIVEGIAPNTPIITVKAEDPDSGDNGKIKYTIKSQEPPGMHFAINETTGNVSTLKNIDREFSDTFRLTVVAMDQAEPISARRSAEKLVTVIVQDINDNAPRFVSMNAGVLYEGSPPGTEIMRVSARDLDANTNGLVTYSMVSGNKDIFRLDRVTGVLSVVKEISDPSIMYSVTVRATDEAVQSQRKSSDAYLTILSASSQEGPKFTQNSYSGSVLESSDIGTSVATVSARLGSTPSTDIAYYVVNVTSSDGQPMDRMFTMQQQQQGVVVTASVLDREDGPNKYMVTVAAVVTQGHTPRLSTTQVMVTVLDKNDSPPSFGDSPLHYTVSEDMLAGRRIAILKATDPDTPGTLTYSIVGGDDNKFTLDAATGHLSLQDTLDRETKSQYDLTVRADDGVQHTDTTVFIEVTDTNDNPPVFHEPAYSFDIPEDADRGSQVGKVSAWDADEGTNGQVSYTVISDWGNDVFSLNPQTGVFTLTSRLDYEQVQHYILVVQAQDTGRPSLSSTVTVYFNVQDLNDNAPIFDPMSYSDEVFENITVGSSVLSVSATDQDSGLNGKLEYTISGGDEKDQFAISSNGTISTKAPLDREDQSFYNLVVRASDMAMPPHARLSSTVQVTIILRDVNDLAPEFVTPNETVVEENTPVNTVVMAVKAVDRDEGRNSYIEYSLAPVPGNRFALGPVDGLLRIVAPLDREDRANYSLVVTARDRGNPPNAHTLTISLRVADENDNSPIFDPKQYSASVPENASIGLSVLQVSATDADDSLNGRVRYTIVAGDKNRDFSISEDTGIIRVAKNLNYERRNHYLLTVQAEDSGADVRYDSATVTISIMDINDNAPVFLDSPYLVYVMENMAALPAPIATVTAFDADNPPYNRVNYLVKEGDKSMFSVNATSGQISLLRALDREERDQYTLTVVAMDTGTPRLTGTGTISVLVQDENDHAPRFEKELYKAEVSEAVDPDTQVVGVAATDKDAGANAKIRYSLVEGAAGVFMVEEWTGIIRTVARLDRERVAQYMLVLQAQDSSLTEARSATTQVMVTVTDENDNAPTFTQSQYLIHVPDPMAPGSFVFGGEALDPDDGPNGRVTYYLSGNDADKFYMNQETGVIKASQALAGEQEYQLEVLATDSGETPLSTTAILQVHLKPNNLFPAFEPLEKTFSFSEAARGDLITTLTATSSKPGPLGAIRFSIAGGNVGQAFVIDENTGELRISQHGLDHETASRYEVWVAAEDSDDPPLASVTQLVVNVNDYNDNAPVFSQSIYNASILEAQYPPQLVATVTATDRDSGINAEVVYQLRRDSPAAEAFTLDSKTGRIYTKIQLDREEVETYTLTVEAVDKGTPAQTGTAMVVVTVQDKNDNPPRFTRLFSVNVTENAEVGTFVIQVTSSDRDIGENANATYSFTENPGGKFYIDSVSGNVTVARAIDRELNDEYLLKVSAVDGSWRAETPLTITVQDENDNAPEFEQSYYVFNFPELQRNVAFVGQVTATDRDKQGPNSIISYSLKFPSDFFSVDPASGDIFSKQALQYKHTLKGPSPENQYQLVVVATDNGKPPMSSESSVVINVVDANNNPPKFLHDRYFTPVPESSAIGQSIIQLKAVDERDFGINAEIEYQKVGGNGTDFFMLEQKTGWITVARQLQNRVDTQFVLLVRALDRGVPPHQDEVLVTLVVTGENKFAPEFEALSYQFSVLENEPLGNTIGSLLAKDGDKGPNGIVRYSITSGNEAGKFAIDESSGDVTIMHPLDYDSVQEYTLNITAHDLAFKPLYSTAVLTVVLTDINDNPPRFSEDQYDAYIAENANAGTTVFKLSATDIDLTKNAVIKYSIVGGDGKEYFSVDPDTGVVTSKRVFDYEEKSQYVLDVRAANPDSSQWSSTTLVVHVTGRNEFFPRFIQSVFQFTVSESAQIGTSVGAIQATDEDKGEDGMVYYLLVGASNDRGFLIQPTTGVITVARSLDRESQNRVVLTVMAKNAGSIRGNDTDEAQITISIQDGNDPPVFSQPLYETRLSEGALVGTLVLTVTAVDSDVQPQNNQFTYSIIGGNLGQVFKVDPQSGMIETTAQLDRETIQVYNLTVGAIDNGSPPQTGTTLVRVILDDVNDNGPRFDPPDIVGYVAENEPAMTSVMTLSATDPDLAPNTQPFTYYIVGGEHREFFTVDQATGEVKTTRSIDRETTPELTFRIEVEDSGKPKMKSEYPVSIIVLDKNDSPSTPRTVTVKVQTFQGVFPGGKVADVHPNDADTAGQYFCEILTQDAAIFSIPNACNLHAARVPRDHTYTLSVSGNDGKHPDVTSKVTLQFESFDNSTLNNSLTLRLLNVTAERFLRLYYKPFVDTLLPLFTGGHVRIYSMLDVDSHTDLTLSVATNGGSSFLQPAEVTRKLAVEEPSLTQSLQGLQLIVDYNPCTDTPCKNGGECSHGIHAYGDTEITDSPSFIFTSPLIRHDVSCKCRQGFTGPRCELRQDPCSPNPCQYGGTCARKGFHFMCTCPPARQGPQCEFDKTNACDDNPCRNGGSCQTTLEGGFFCLCRPGYRGNQCELASESCRPNPCLNGGSCVSLKPGYHCSCKTNFYGTHCEKSTFSFSELSYMTFPTLDSTTNDISITFSTNKPDALLVYNYGLQTGGRSDFVAIELKGGQPRFSFGGARTAISRIQVERSVSDGKWYKLTATRNGRVISLSVAACTHNGETCDDCRPNDGSCYSDDTGRTGTLNFNNEPMYLGGVMTVDPLQERPGQVLADDFIGCIQAVSINGRPLNLTGPIQARGISDTCERVADVCAGNPCGEGSTCLDRWSTHMCRCANGLVAPDCEVSLRPASFTRGAYVEFLITEQHRRRQLLPRLYEQHSRWSRDIHARRLRQVPPLPPKSLSFSFRTRMEDGLLLHSATNNDFTLVEVRGGQLQYTSKLGANQPINMTIPEVSVSDGEWHNLTLLAAQSTFRLVLDGVPVGEGLDLSYIHDFLDAYLTSLTLGAAPRFSGQLPYTPVGFVGCMSTFSVDGEVQPLNSTGSLLEAVARGVSLVTDCTAADLGPAASTDPLSIGITLVIVFFVLLLVAILVSFIVYRVRRQRREKSGVHVKQNGSALLANTSSDSGRSPQDSGYVESAEMTDDVLRSHLSQELATKKYKERDHERPQRPDIIEREVMNKSPGVPLRVDESQLQDRDAMAGLGHMPDSEAPEHYDLENASSIAASDIDIVYHYKGYRDGNVRKYKTNPHVPGYHKHNHRHSPHNFPNTPHRESPRNLMRQSPNPVAPRESPSVLKMQATTPLARLSPSSELSQQTPRILTLQDISGKPLQTALLASSQGPGVKDVMSTSERSLNSPVSHLSQSSGSMHASSQSTKKKKHDSSVSLGLTPEEIERLNTRPRNSSLVSTLDAVSSSSEDNQRKDKLAELIETNTELLEPPDSSTDESGNDSFTCSEFEYENNYEKVTRDFGPGNMIFSKLAEVDNENEHDNESAKNYDGFDSFRGSLSTLVASDDDLSNMSSYKPPNGSTFGWDYLLNWGPNFESLVGVFKDIAELPDNTTNGRVSARGTPKPSEEYV